MKTCYSKSDPLAMKLEAAIGPQSAQNIYRANNYNDFKNEEQIDAYIKAHETMQKGRLNTNSSMSFEKIKLGIQEKMGAIFKKDEKYYYKDNITKEITRVSEVIEEFKRDLGRQWVGEKGTNFYALKGKVLHEFMAELNKAVFKNEPVNQLAISKNIIEKLSKEEDFKDKKSSFFVLTPAQFNHLADAVRELKNNLTEINNEIKANTGLTQDLEIFSELTVFDPINDIGGTIDLVVLFADGSAAVYDYKSLISVEESTQSLSKQMDWHMQMSQYVNILKNHYGITTIRQARIIPISVKYDGKTNKESGNDITNDSFKSVGIFTKKNKSKFLRPFAITEETTGDSNLDILVRKLDQARSDLLQKRQRTKAKSQRFRLSMQIKSLTKGINDILIERDVATVLESITDLIKRYSDRVGIPEHLENHLPYNQLVEGYHEIEVYQDLPVFFKDQLKQLKKAKSTDSYAKVQKQMESLSVSIKNLKQDMLNDIIRRSGGERILNPGQGISQIGMLFNGLDNWHIPIFEQLKTIYSTAQEAARMDTEREFSKISKVHEDLVKWGKANGYTGQNLYELFIDKKTGLLHEKYNNEFITKFQKLTELSRKSPKDENYRKLTNEEKNWLTNNFKVDEKAVNEARENLKRELQEEVDTKDITKGEMNERLAVFDKFSNPITSPELFFRGNNPKDPSRVFIVPSEKANNFLSDRYEFIQQNTPLKNYLNLYNEIMQKYRSYYGAEVIHKLFVPVVHQDLTDLIARKGILAISEIKETMKQKYKIREHDEVVGTLINGKKVKSIPLLYVEKLRTSLSKAEEVALESEIVFPKNSTEYKNELARRKKQAEYEKGLTNQSIDLTKSLMLFVASANEHMHLTQIEPMVQGLQIVIRSEKMLSQATNANNKVIYNKTVGKILKYIGAESDIIDAFSKFVDRLVYKQQFDSELWTSEKYSSNKIVQGSMQFFSTMAIGANVVLVASNYLTARNNLWMLSKENRYFNKQDWDKSMKWFAKQDKRFEDIYDFIQPTTRDYLREAATDSSMNFRSRFFRTQNLFIGHLKGDDRIDAALAVAMSLKYRVDSDGRIKNPDLPGQQLLNPDAPTVSESIKRDADGMTYIEGLTIEEFGKYRDTVRKLGQRIKGMTNEKQKGLIYSTMIGTMFMHLRSWLPGMATTRFGRLEFDTTLGGLEQGRFAVAFGEIIHGGVLPTLTELTKFLGEAVSMGYYTRNPNMKVIEAKYQQFINQNIDLYGPNSETPLTLDDFVALHKAKMNSFVAEIRIYMAFFLLLSLVGGLKWDDDDEGNLFTWNAQQVLRRSLLELSFWLSPTAAGDIIKSPIPLYGLVVRLNKIFSNAIVQTSYLVRGERDPRDNKYFGYYTLRTIPAVNQILNIMRVFEPYRPPRSTFEKVFFEED